MSEHDHFVDAARYTIKMPPPPVGWWVLPGDGAYKTKLSAYSKPNWFHRKMMLWILGFKWEEAK